MKDVSDAEKKTKKIKNVKIYLKKFYAACCLSAFR